jgi:hypothetical protein
LEAARAVTAFPAGSKDAEAQAMNHIYRLRTYTASDGKLDELLTRFRGGEIDLFHKHGMESVGYWVPRDEPLSETTLVYIVRHDSREAANASWIGFGGDPEWHAMRDESEANGSLTSNVQRQFLIPTDFSPAK